MWRSWASAEQVTPVSARAAASLAAPAVAAADEGQGPGNPGDVSMVRGDWASPGSGVTTELGDEGPGGTAGLEPTQVPKGTRENEGNLGAREAPKRRDTAAKTERWSLRSPLTNHRMPSHRGGTRKLCVFANAVF